MYDVNHFIKKFEAIPEELWCTGALHRYSGDTIYSCAMGHCGKITRFGKPHEATALSRLFKLEIGVIPELVNDWDISTRYCSLENCIKDILENRTPKARILAALYLIKARQQKAIRTPELSQSVIEDFLEPVTA